MSVYSTTAVEVYELTEQWNFTITNTGISGTRVYLETTTDLPGLTRVSLPNMGDTWNSDYTNVTLKSISMSLVSNKETCGKKYTCNYDGMPFNQVAVPLSDEDVPRTIEVGGEYITWVESGSGSFYWPSDTKKVEQAMAFQVSLANFRMYRVISKTKLDDYMVVVMNLVNTLNNKTFLGFPVEMVMFTGANLSEFKNRIGATRWRVELNFSVRQVTDKFPSEKEPNTPTDGWNYILRQDTGKWERPVFGGATPIYPTSDLSTLFNAHELGSDENLYIVPPAK